MVNAERLNRIPAFVKAPRPVKLNLIATALAPKIVHINAINMDEPKGILLLDNLFFIFII